MIKRRVLVSFLYLLLGIVYIRSSHSGKLKRRLNLFGVDGGVTTGGEARAKSSGAESEEKGDHSTEHEPWRGVRKQLERDGLGTKGARNRITNDSQRKWSYKRGEGRNVLTVSVSIVGCASRRTITPDTVPDDAPEAHIDDPYDEGDKSGERSAKRHEDSANTAKACREKQVVSQNG